MCLHSKEPESSSAAFVLGRETPWRQSPAAQERCWREGAQQHLCRWCAASSAGGRGSSARSPEPARNCTRVQSVLDKSELPAPLWEEKKRKEKKREKKQPTIRSPPSLSYNTLNPQSWTKKLRRKEKTGVGAEGGRDRQTLGRREGETDRQTETETQRENRCTMVYSITITVLGVTGAGRVIWNYMQRSHDTDANVRQASCCMSQPLLCHSCYRGKSVAMKRCAACWQYFPAWKEESSQLDKNQTNGKTTTEKQRNKKWGDTIILWKIYGR